MTRVGRCKGPMYRHSFLDVTGRATERRSPRPSLSNGALGFALDALRDELGLSVADLADRTNYDIADLRLALEGDVPASGIYSAVARALADTIAYEERLAGVA